MTTASPPLYPVQVTGHLDDHLSRWLWLVKWLLVLPHLLVLMVLWLGFAVLTAAAFVAILVTGRYPRPVFDVNVGVLRWTWRVAYYAYGALGTDRYPPFTLADRPDYPARFEVVYPEHLSRRLVLVQWWLLAIPHYLVVGLFVGGGAWVLSRTETGAGPGLVGLLVLFAGVVLLVRGQYPRSLFDLVLGLNRWALRVAAYAGLMTDRYPPFRLDLGGDEPGTVSVQAPPPQAAPPPPTDHQPAPEQPPTDGWTGGRTAGLVTGVLALVVGLGLAAGGAGLLLLDGPARSSDGYVLTGYERLATSTAALEARVELPVEGPSWFYGPEQLGTVRIDVVPASGEPLFVGIAARDDAATFLTGTSHDRLDDLRADPGYSRSGGSESAPVPAGQPWWVAADEGTGPLSVTWPAQEGDWSVVLLRSDGSPDVAAEVRVGATLPHLHDIGLGLLAVGLVVAAGGAVGMALTLRGSSGGGR
jgi:hypothetical protein